MYARIGWTWLVLALMAADDPKPKSNDVKTLDGTWLVTRAERSGQAADRPVGDTLTFRSGMLKFVTKEGQEWQGTYTIDVSQTPMTIDVSHKRPNSDEEIQVPGIFRIEGDELTVCFSDPTEGERPTEFKTVEGKRTMMVVLKRENP